MKALALSGLEVVPYKLPLGGAAIQAADAPLREGLEIQVEFEGGRRADGDAAPLPGHSTETLAQARSAAERASVALRGACFSSVEEIAALLDPLDLPAATRHGIEQALLYGLADARGEAPSTTLGATDAPERVRINALVQTEEEATRAVTAGYTELKLKVAREPLAADLARIARVRAAVGPGVELRLDANGRWSEDIARAALAELEGHQIAYIEQPVAELEALAALRRAQRIPLAADELCRSPAAARQIIEAEAADLLVLKPMLCGGLLAAREIAYLALAAGLEVVVTSSLESAIGCHGALQLAAALPPPRRAAGLTSSDPRWPQRPRMRVTDVPGKGPRA